MDSSQPRSADGLRLTRLRREPGGIQTWQVVGRPYSVVGLSAGWLVVGTDPEARELAVHRGLAGRRFPSRRLAVRALDAALAE
jgi:hypothetical protein